MKELAPTRAVVASFSSSAAPQAGFEYDSSDYVLSMTSSSAFAAVALSNQSIIQYDMNTAQVLHQIQNAHDRPISEICFFPPDYHGLGQSHDGSPSHLVISSSQDGTVKIFDLRTRSSTAAVTSKLQLPNEQALTISLGFGGTLAAVGTSKARISFFDLRCTSGNNPSGQWMGNYVDAHTDEVTRVRFQTVSDKNSLQQKTVLATASEDGLISIHDPSQSSEDAALVSVLNIGTPLRDIGFFGPNYEGLYALTGNETMSVWHWDSAQKISDCGGVCFRELLSKSVDQNNAANDDGSTSVEYLVGCEWGAMHGIQTKTISSPALHLVAGNAQGDGYIFRVDTNQITPVAHLKGGHRGCIRDFCWGNGKLITGGEDARICDWDLSGNNRGTSLDQNARGSGKVYREKRSKGKETKKLGSPY